MLQLDNRKTYIKTLIVLVLAVCRYTGRWDVQIRRNLPEAAIPLYEALRVACDAFIEVVDNPPKP